MDTTRRSFFKHAAVGAVGVAAATKSAIAAAAPAAQYDLIIMGGRLRRSRLRSTRRAERFEAASH